MTDYCCCLLEASVCYLSSNVFCVMETSKLNEDSAAFESKKCPSDWISRSRKNNSHRHITRVTFFPVSSFPVVVVILRT